MKNNLIYYLKMEEDWHTIGLKPKVNLKSMSKKKEQQQKENQAHQEMMSAFYADQKYIKPKPIEIDIKSKIDCIPSKLTEDDIGVYKLRVLSVEKRSKLQHLREQKGLNRKEVATLTATSVQIINDYENGKGNYDPETYNRIIQKLNKLPDKFLKN